MTDEPQALDKHERPLKVGDIVDFVYGGEPHHMEIAAISQGMGAQVILTGIVDVSIPSTSAGLAPGKKVTLASRAMDALKHRDSRQETREEKPTPPEPTPNDKAQTEPKTTKPKGTK